MDELLLGSSASIPTIAPSLTTSPSLLDTHCSITSQLQLLPDTKYASDPFDEFMDCHYDDPSGSLSVNLSEVTCSSATPSFSSGALDDGHSVKHRVVRKNLIIWDWDDTIFPTFSFRTHQDRKDKLFMTKLRTLVSFTEEIFEGMIDRYGASNIVIVTNASSKWIEKCLSVEMIQSIYSHFASLLQKHRISTISASTPNITKNHPDDPHKWKEVVFHQLFTDHFDCDGDAHSNIGTVGISDGNALTAKLKEVQCITSIGDSLCEFKASDRASKWMAHRVLNRVRLRPNPSIDEMIDQFETIASMIDDFGSSTDGIELDFNSPPSPALSSTSMSSGSSIYDS